MPYFVFAEFGSAVVVNFLTDLRQALQGRPDTSPIHVTLQGPYKSPPKLEQLDKSAQLLRGLGVAIKGHGYFSTPKGFAVFVLAECTAFRDMWNKPDFRGPREDIRPHITLFESQNRDAAQQVKDFLRRENMLIHTYNVHLSIYESRAMQPDLFSRPTVVPAGKTISRDLYRIPDGMLDKARQLGARIAQLT
jgi:hypothetical protein